MLMVCSALNSFIQKRDSGVLRIANVRSIGTTQML